MLISLIVTNGENFKVIEEPSLTALGDLEWNDPIPQIHSISVSVCFQKNLLSQLLRSYSVGIKF